MFPTLFETSNKTYKATLKKPFTNIILGSGYNMFLAKNQAIYKNAQLGWSTKKNSSGRLLIVTLAF